MLVKKITHKQNKQNLDNLKNQTLLITGEIYIVT